MKITKNSKTNQIIKHKMHFHQHFNEFQIDNISICIKLQKKKHFFEFKNKKKNSKIKIQCPFK